MHVRTSLYVPGDRPDMLVRALDRGADAIVADLEDGVAPASKTVARGVVAGWLGALRDKVAIGRAVRRTPEVELWVRVNPGELLADDVGAVVGPGLTGICLPKAESVGQLCALDDLLTSAEAAASVAVGSVGVVALVESARGVLALREIATAPRVRRLGIGEVDLASDLGVQAGPDGHELAWVRSQLVVHSAAAGLQPPLASVWTDLRDTEGLRRSSEALRRLGYSGRACIHPAQVPVVGQAFTPGVSEVAQAQRLLAQFDAAVACGQGVITDEHGRMVDEAVVRAARRTLAARR